MKISIYLNRRVFIMACIGAIYCSLTLDWTNFLTDREKETQHFCKKKLNKIFSVFEIFLRYFIFTTFFFFFFFFFFSIFFIFFMICRSVFCRVRSTFCRSMFCHKPLETDSTLHEHSHMKPTHEISISLQKSTYLLLNMIYWFFLFHHKKKF